MAEDLVLGERELLQYLINGGGPVVGLQARMDLVFASWRKTPKVQLRYSYDTGRQGLVLIEAPLDRPLVTLLVNNRLRESFYHRNRHPTLPVLAWVRRVNMQWDIWGRTPVEVSAIGDALERECLRMHLQLWDNNRIALQLETFEDAPYEVDTKIFRAIARGYCTTAQMVAV